MNWLKKLFNTKKVDAQNVDFISDGWIAFKDEKPPHEVVLAACDSSDCDWVMDTVWWYEDGQCWMTTGGVKSKVAPLEYSHWRKLPSPPNIK